MEIEGMIIHALEPKSGQSTKTGNMWKKKEYVLETTGQYPRKVKFDVWGDRADTMIFELGKSYSISVDIESREYNGNWYTDVKAYSSRPLEQVAGMPQQAAPAAAPANPFPGVQQAPVNNPFGAAPAPDFSAGDSQEDLPF